MASLTREELALRLKFDYRVAERMSSEIMTVRAFQNANDVRSGKNPIVDQMGGHLATHYLVDFRIRTLVGEGRYTDVTTVHFDLTCNGRYPYSEPACWVVSEKMPWSPHFKQGMPICIGEFWKDGRGKILIAQLMVHVARLLNFDEIARGGGYVGWNAEAVRYWKNELGLQPINTSLVYPTLPSDITHGIASPAADRSSMFSPTNTVQNTFAADFFKPV